jgi:hypothetical protein
MVCGLDPHSFRKEVHLGEEAVGKLDQGREYSLFSGLFLSFLFLCLSPASLLLWRCVRI